MIGNCLKMKNAASSKKLRKRRLFIALYLSLFIVFAGCATTQKQGNILAVVEGEPITGEDIGYSLEVAHRREDLSKAKSLDISGYIQSLINDRLIIHEAIRMGMDKEPEVWQKVRDYILRESVVRLYNDEIQEKASVTEEEIMTYYKENYERFVLDVIEADTEENARKILEKLDNGEDFEEFSEEYPAKWPEKEGSEFIFKRMSMRPALWKAVERLNPGQYSDIVKIWHKYYIIELISRQDAPDEELEGARRRIDNILGKQKIKERSDEYLALLREKGDIKINHEILSTITKDASSEERKQWLQDKRPLVELNGNMLTVGEFAATLPSADDATKEKMIRQWLNIKLVDREALGRHYELGTELKDMAARYKNKLLKSTFIKKVIIPDIHITDEEAREYFLSHQEIFAKPVKYKIQQITLKSREDAEEVLNSLKGSADFAWLAKTRSVDSSAPRGGAAGWKTGEELPAQVTEILETLEPGEFSQVLEINGLYTIIRLAEKTGKKTEKFEKVKPFARKAAYREKFRKIYDAYVNKLKEDAQIEIFDNAVREFEDIFKK